MRRKVGIARRFYRKILYSDIDRVYSKHFNLKQKPRNGKKVLDVGMGFGFDLITKYREGYDCFGFDNDRFRVAKTRNMFKKNGVHAKLKVGTATRIPFGRNMFDEVICHHVIEHVQDDRKILREIYRVMKKGGTLYLRTPNVHNLHTKFHMKIKSKNPYTDRTHVREYSKSDLVKLVKEAGFKVTSTRQSGFFPPVGLKLFMIADHYLPLSQAMKHAGKKFPKHAAEIVLVAKK